MLENIISLVKDQVADKITGTADIPEDKKGQAVEATTTSIIDGLKSYITPENISSLTSLLGNGSANHENSSSVQQSNITQGIQSNVISSLTSKVGLNQGSASKIAMMVVPAVMAMFSRKANDNSDSGFNLGSLISTFTGGGKSSSGSGKGILETVGSFFGK